MAAVSRKMSWINFWFSGGVILRYLFLRFAFFGVPVTFRVEPLCGCRCSGLSGLRSSAPSTTSSFAREARLSQPSRRPRKRLGPSSTRRAGADHTFHREYCGSRFEEADPPFFAGLSLARILMTYLAVPGWRSAGS